LAEVALITFENFKYYQCIGLPVSLGLEDIQQQLFCELMAPPGVDVVLLLQARF
jgi:hypothetical protein